MRVGRQTGGEQLGDMPQRVPASGGEDGSSASPVAIFLRFTPGTTVETVMLFRMSDCDII